MWIVERQMSCRGMWTPANHHMLLVPFLVILLNGYFVKAAPKMKSADMLRSYSTRDVKDTINTELAKLRAVKPTFQELQQEYQNFVRHPDFLAYKELQKKDMTPEMHKQWRMLRLGPYISNTFLASYEFAYIARARAYLPKMREFLKIKEQFDEDRRLMIGLYRFNSNAIGVTGKVIRRGYGLAANSLEKDAYEFFNSRGLREEVEEFFVSEDYDKWLKMQAGNDSETNEDVNQLDLALTTFAYSPIEHPPGYIRAFKQAFHEYFYPPTVNEVSDIPEIDALPDEPVVPSEELSDEPVVPIEELSDNNGFNSLITSINE